MIEDLGGADICYSGPGWTGHLAFIEPDAPEFAAPLDEWKKMSSRIVTLSPYTIAQNSLYGTFGKSGNLAAVPPKAATIGPAEVIQAKKRMDTHAITVHGTTTTWQRFISRLVLHGPVTPLVPESILQTLPTEVYVSENIAQNIEPDWNKGY
jgi:glucosamine-6-phosphate deaminase